ncbi:MAG TPA: IS481 family transposase [Sporichthyaceae bacterium]
MLVELSVVEQRYHAVMEVLSAGVPVVEVAERYGVSRKTVHAWIRRYRVEGLAGLIDKSHRPHRHPWQIAAESEALICEMRRNHARWGPRRLGHELARVGVSPVPSRSSIYRILVRHQLISPVTRKRARSDYRRWERPASMQLWQIDIMGSVFLTDPAASGGVREVKLVSGIDDHSRYAVIATVVPRATSRAVCAAFLDALHRFGVPEQVLTDNGIQFTGKYVRPRAGEVLFDQICRHNGIDHLLTKIRSPTTTGKIERWHQSIQTELLDEHGPFADLPAAQLAVDEWVHQYNHSRPHQARDMDPPAAHFHPVAPQRRAVLPLWTPPELASIDGVPGLDDPPSERAAEPEPVRLAPAVSTVAPDPLDAVEIDRVVPASGNLGVCGQQFWLGTHRAGHTITLWIDTTTVHLSVGGMHLKTLPSRMTTTHLARLRIEGARPAAPSPIDPAWTGGPIEISRTVNACGNVTVAGQYVSVGAQHAGRRVILRLDGDLAQVIVDGTLTRTTALSITTAQRNRLRDARAARPRPQPDHQPARTQRKVSARGTTMVIGQKVRVGLPHAGKIVTIEIGESVLDIYDEPGNTLITQTPRTSTQHLARFKAYGVNRTRTTG